MTINLKTAWALWEKAEKGWEDAKIEAKPEAYEVPGEKPKTYTKPKNIVTKKESPSGINSLEKEKNFVPGKDKDAKVMQLKTDIKKLEEALMELELQPEVDEAFMTPDVGTSVLGRSMFTGAALEPPNGYGRNFGEDPPAPEEGSGFQDQDSANSLVSQQHFIPKESRDKLAEMASIHNQSRLKKIRG
jgi:hypothetical protein